MASMKLGSKSDAFQRQGQAWFCATGLPSDVIVEVEEMSFHLHKFPLSSRSGVMERLIGESSSSADESGTVIKLPDIPGGAKTFELIAKFCYGVRLELTSSNAVHLRCASEHLEMTEEYGEGNLISRSETFLSQVVLRNWKDSLIALQTCDSDDVASFAEQLNIPKRCIDSLASKACSTADPNLFGWPVMEHLGPMQSPGGSVLWNGISTGARVKPSSSDWWYEDASTLSLPRYKKLISAMESRGARQEVIAGSLNNYARKYLPALNRRKGSTDSSRSGTQLTEEEQKVLLEEIDQLLPVRKGLVPTKFLFGLLKTAKIIRAGPACVSSLERRIGMQLDQATLEDLLMPNFSHSMETLYDVDCVQRILEHFLATDQAVLGEDDDGASSDGGRLVSSPSLAPVTAVAKLVDGYLAEIAPDVNVKLPKFQTLACAVPEYARPLDDGLYRAIDMYLKSHPWLVESDREQLCRLMDCQKLSLEACTHAAQNERLPLRVIVQVLFFEQLQLRTSIASCLLASEGSRQLRSGGAAGPTDAVSENRVLKVGMDSMRVRVSELEKECTNMRREIEQLGGRNKGKGTSGGWGSVSRRIGFKLKTQQMCSAQEGSVSKQTRVNEKDDLKARKERHGKERKKITLIE